MGVVSVFIPRSAAFCSAYDRAVDWYCSEPRLSLSGLYCLCYDPAELIEGVRLLQKCAKPARPQSSGRFGFVESSHKNDRHLSAISRRRSSVSSPPDNGIGISRTISRISSWCALNVSVRRSADQKLTSKQRYPFPHSQNAKRSARGALLFRDTHTVILNVEGQAIALTCQSYLDLRSVGVPRDVSQGLQPGKAAILPDGEG
jgi:hypothetical protein